MLAKLRDLWRKRQAEVSSQYDRSLPFADYIVDRWDKARQLGFGEGTSVYDSCLVLGRVQVGAHTWVGPFTVLDGTGGGLRIGDHCSISAGVQIYTHDTVKRSLSGGIAPIEQAVTTIGNNCYIGPNAVIAKGVTIGDRVVIGANSLVLEDVPSDSRAYGTPSRSEAGR